MFSKKIIINILSAVFVIGVITFGMMHFNKPRIDISTDEKMKTSVERLKDSLNDEQKTKFEQALRYIAFDGLTLSDIMSADETIKRIKDKLKNKSYALLFFRIPKSIILYFDFIFIFFFYWVFI